MNNWVEDIKGAESDDEDESGDSEGSTLFQDNFRRMVEQGSVDSLNPQTIKNQINQINDPELLAEAIGEDSREECSEVYKDRLGTLNERNIEEDGGDDVESDPESNDSAGGPSSSPSDSNFGSDSGGESAEPSEETDEEPTEVEESETTDLNDDEDETDETEQVDGPETEGSETDGDSEEADGEEVDEDPDSTTETEPSDDSVEDEGNGSEVSEESIDDHSTGSQDGLPEVSVAGIAPDATARENAVEQDPQHTMLIWGQEGTGKTHVAHSAPEPIAYIDTEGKADDIADKFEKEIYYFQPDDYQDATDALDQAFELLKVYREKGHLGTIVVDSITKMWDWAKQDYQELAYPSADDPSEVDFKSALQGEDDWAQIKRRHNKNFRDKIVDSPYHVVFTAMAKEDYNAVMEGADGKPMTADGEKQNPYVVKDEVRLRTNGEGKTVADLHKAAKTRYSFIGLEWPEFDDIYDAIEMVAEAEQSPEPVDVTQWPFEVVEGRPTMASTDGSDKDNDD